MSNPSTKHCTPLGPNSATWLSPTFGSPFAASAQRLPKRVITIVFAQSRESHCRGSPLGLRQIGYASHEFQRCFDPVQPPFHWPHSVLEVFELGFENISTRSPPCHSSAKTLRITQLLSMVSLEIALNQKKDTEKKNQNGCNPIY